MDLGQIGTIIILVLVLAVFAAGFIAYRKISSKVREFSQLAFGTNDILKGLKKVETESQVTPKSVSAATGLYLPNIMRDFPDFHYDEMKTRAENLLTSYLHGISTLDVGCLTEGTSELKDKLNMKIEMLKSAEKREHFENIKIQSSFFNENV